MNEPITINIEKYLTKDPKIRQQLFDIIDQEKRVLLVANPRTGKTTFSVELMSKQKNAGHRFVYATFLTAIPIQNQKKFKFDLICSHESQEWKQREDDSNTSGVYLQKDDLVIGTTLHQLNKFADELTDKDIIVIDEAHQLVQLSHIGVIHDLRKELLNTEAQLLLMTGTPYEEECKWLNLTKVDVLEANPRIDNLIYIPLTSKLREKTSIQDLTANLIHYHLSKGNNKQTKKVLIYNNQSKVDNATLSKTILDKAGYIIDDINADRKNTLGYQYILKKERIRPEAHGIVTTSSLKEGINIKNTNIDYIFVLGPMTLKDEKQIVKRIRRKNPLEVYRIYNEPGKDRIEDVEYEIDFIEWLTLTCKKRPERFTKILQKQAKCSMFLDKKGLLSHTGILDKNVKSIDEVKVLHIMEVLNAQKSTLDDYLKRQTCYNDLAVQNGHDYLKNKYNITLIGNNKALGQFNLHLDKQRTEIIKDKHEELHSILLYLFGQCKYFDITIELLKNELVGYFDGGSLLRDISTRTITSIKNTKYTNPIIKNDPFKDLDDADIKDELGEIIEIFASRYRKEMKATIEILHFLINNTKYKKDVLPVLSEAIDPSKLLWHADRFKLSLKLVRIQSFNPKSGKKLNIRNKPLTKEERLISNVIDEIKSHQKKYGVVYVPLLEKYVSNNLSTDQFYNSLNLGDKNKLKSYVFALGIVKEKSSYKRSRHNQDKFDRLWKADGRTGIPNNRRSIGRVLILKPCTPAQLIQYYRNALKTGSSFVV